MVGVCSLEITSCTLDDAARYTCSARNVLGEADTSCRVVVHGELGRSCYIIRYTLIAHLIGLITSVLRQLVITNYLHYMANKSQ